MTFPFWTISLKPGKIFFKENIITMTKLKIDPLKSINKNSYVTREDENELAVNYI